MDNNHSALIAAAELNEKTEIDQEVIRRAVTMMLSAFGEDPDRQGLIETPDRVARMYEELLGGYRVEPVSMINDAIFEVDYSEMVIVRDVEFYSLCEHHLLPFIGKAHVAYLPDHRVIGLSKIPRIVDMFSRRLQVQERMTDQIGKFLQEAVHPLGVAVAVEAVHLCSMVRGVKKHDARMTTFAMLGAFKTDMSLRNQFLSSIAPNSQLLTL